MLTLPQLTARLGAVASCALFLAACNPDSKGVSGLSGPTLSANREGSSKSSGGASSNFAVLANAAVTCTDGTIIGDVGTFLATPPGAITLTRCPLTGSTHIGDAASKAAYQAFLTTYAALAPKTTDVCPIITGTLAGQNLAPGVYCISAEAKTGVLTLNGPSTGTWVFKVPSGALTGTSFSVVMAGGGLACNVTWWVNAGSTMTTSAFQGNILAGAAITLTGGTFNGNAWAGAAGVGDVTITGTAVTGCKAGATGGGDEGEGEEGEHGEHGEHGHHGEHDGHGERGHDRDSDHERGDSNGGDGQ